MGAELLRSEASFVYTQPTGRQAVASRLVEGLRAAGYECNQPSDIGYAETFRCMVDDQDFSIVVGLMDDGVREWLVSTNSRLKYWQRLWKSPDTESHRKLAKAVHLVLKADPFLTELRWYTSEDFAQSPDDRWKPHP